MYYEEYRMVLIAVAPNGARKTKDDLATIPLTAEELAKEAKLCQEAGAAMIHLHVRDRLGRHSLSVEIYQDAIRQIREATEDKIFIQVTSEAVGKYTAEEQFEMIHGLKPDAVSMAIREIRKFDEIEIYENFDFMRRHNIYPQIILYNDHDVTTYTQWLEDGVLPGNAYPVLYVIGKSQAKGMFSHDFSIEKNGVVSSSWMVCGFGEFEYKVATKAVDLGGSVRLGFENNHLLEDGSEAENNAAIITQIADYIRSKNISLATHVDAMKMMKPDW